MSVYMLFLRENPPHDPAEMEKYTQLAVEAAGDFKLTPLAVYGPVEPLEGNAPDGVVLLEFDSEEEAKAWYYSPTYQAARRHRMQGASYRALLIHGVAGS